MADENEDQDLDDRLLARMLRDFLEEAPEHLDQLNLKLIQLEKEPEEDELIDDVFRTVHTLKGSAAFVGLEKISEISRKMEDVFGAVRKGTLNITTSIIDIMYEGLDVLTNLIAKSTGDDGPDVDSSPIVRKLDGIHGNAIPEPEEETFEQKTETLDFQELLSIYKASYEQLAALKHLVYSSTHLSDPESLALHFSKQIDERMRPEKNSVWLVEHGKNVVEVARDGTLVEKGNRRIIEIESSEVLRHVIREQLVAWSSSLPQVREVFPEFDSPIVFPIKSQPEAFGFLVLHPEEETEVEIYQLIGQFAAMIFRISELHQKLKEQTEELNEMTEILFKQNAQLSSLYHVELDLMKVADPVHLCRIVVEAAVSELEAKRAAAFLVDGSSRELIGASESGGVEGIDSMRFPIDENEPLKQAIESGRVVTYSDYGDELHLGPNLLEKWIVVCFKGREHVQGVLVTELKDEDIGDSIAILANYSGILLDNLMLQEEVGNVANKTQGRKSDELHQ